MIHGSGLNSILYDDFRDRCCKIKVFRAWGTELADCSFKAVGSEICHVESYTVNTPNLKPRIDT